MFLLFAYFNLKRGMRWLCHPCRSAPSRPKENVRDQGIKEAASIPSTMKKISKLVTIVLNKAKRVGASTSIFDVLLFSIV